MPPCNCTGKWNAVIFFIFIFWNNIDPTLKSFWHCSPGEGSGSRHLLPSSGTCNNRTPRRAAASSPGCLQDWNWCMDLNTSACLVWIQSNISKELEREGKEGFCIFTLYQFPVGIHYMNKFPSVSERLPAERELLNHGLSRNFSIAARPKVNSRYLCYRVI